MLTLVFVIFTLTLAAAANARRWPSPPAWWRTQAYCIARYESGGDWHNRRNPVSRGGLQIIPSTWSSVGGRGDPADASPAEQLWRAYLIWRRDGGSWREWTTRFLCHLR